MAHRIYKLHIVGDSVFTMCVEVADGLEKNMPSGNAGQLWDVTTYRLSSCNKFVEHYEQLGAGWKISDTQLVVELTANQKARMDSECDALKSSDPLARRALIFLPKGSQLAAKSFKSAGKADFTQEVEPEVLQGGIVAYPVEYGFSPKAVTCTCKAFFGCTTGCCTSPACNVVLGLCQENAECKKVDTLSDCQCRKD